MLKTTDAPATEEIAIAAPTETTGVTEETAPPPKTTADRMMEEAQTAPPEDAPPIIVPISHEEALKKSQEAFGTAEAGLVSAYASIENGSHDDMASCRGTLSTLLAQLRNAWPGGKKS